MKRYSRTLHFFTHGIRGLLLALICAAALFVSGCSKDGDTINQVPTPTTGTLNVTVNPPSTTVVVTGPNSFTQTFSGNNNLTNLEPGLYTAKASAPGFEDATGSATVVIDKTVPISLVLKALPIVENAPPYVYRDGSGNLIPVTAGQFSSGQYVFYAWLQDLPSGIVPANLTTATVTDPHQPLPTEQKETAPNSTQNLAAAWVGVKDAAGVIHPVIGADVRWTIEEQYAGNVGSIVYGASDDNAQSSVVRKMKHIDDPHQASTRTNNKNLANERFPLVVTEYPLYNLTGIGTPNVDGFTWVTLFSADKIASGRIIVVATVNGEEIGKQILYKNFAPAPKLQITKTVTPAVVNLVNGTAPPVTWTVTVKNVGEGDATNVKLNDTLLSGVAGGYTRNSIPVVIAPITATANTSGGYDSTFTLAAGATVTQTFTATATAAGTYCNQGQITSYDAAINTVSPVDLKAQVCFTAVAPILSIVKDFVAADGTTSLGKTLTVAVNQSANLRVRVINSGTGAATGVAVNDVLTSGVLANYTLTSVSPVTPIVGGGFSYNIGALGAGGATSTMLLAVKASADGTYCDTATVSATSGTIDINHDQACLTVSTPNLTITKTEDNGTVLPGGNYTSTIVVTNAGTATAKNVVISDLLGLNSTGNVWAIYMSSNSSGTAGTLVNHTVTAPHAVAVDIPVNGSITFTVVSQIPPGAAAGNYCDTATFTSDNAGTKDANACVNVPAFSAVQIQLVDLSDPVLKGTNVTYFTVLYVEALSNEGVNNNVVTYLFGHASAIDLVTPGIFDVTSTKVYLDSAPVRDPVTGLVISDATNPTAVLKTAGTDYTLSSPLLGKQVITMTPSVELLPNTALYVVQVVNVPSTTANGMYTTSDIWSMRGIGSANSYQGSSSEPTTVY